MNNDLSVVRVPPEVNYVEAYLTFRCPLSCPYCINAYDGSFMKDRGELDGWQWLRGLRRLSMNSDLPITLGGGEPTTHDHFYDIVCGLRDYRVDVLTNLSCGSVEFIDNCPRKPFVVDGNDAYKAIRVSYHCHSPISPEDLVGYADDIQKAGYSIGIFAISHPDAIVDNCSMAELCRKRGIYFFVKDYLGEYNGQMMGCYKWPEAVSGCSKKCMCRTNELLIGPDGSIFRCHRDLYANEGSIGNLLDDDLKLEWKHRPCDKFGQCNPCDVKLKTNRFMVAGSSSVDIQDVED